MSFYHLLSSKLLLLSGAWHLYTFLSCQRLKKLDRKTKRGELGGKSDLGCPKQRGKKTTGKKCVYNICGNTYTHTRTQHTRTRTRTHPHAPTRTHPPTHARTHNTPHHTAPHHTTHTHTHMHATCIYIYLYTLQQTQTSLKIEHVHACCYRLLNCSILKFRKYILFISSWSIFAIFFGPRIHQEKQVHPTASPTLQSTVVQPLSVTLTELTCGER